MNRRIEITIAMCQQDALLIRHRGLWCYDPLVFGRVEQGDLVDFTCCGKHILTALVISKVQSASDLPRWLHDCSRINSDAFWWTEYEDQAASLAT